MDSRRLAGAVTRRRVAGVLILGILGMLGWAARDVVRAFGALRALERRLPDLPPVHAVSTRTGSFPVKIWLHRVNSVERAALMAKKYRGLEIDVVYDSSGKSFDVGHPPTPSAGISLDHLLAAVPDVSHHYFWIDFKNLSHANARAASRVLLRIAQKYGVQHNMIVESSNPTALNGFTDLGFYTSYYLFEDSSLQSMSTEEIRKYYEEVKANLAASRVNAVSSDYYSMPFIEKYLPEGDVLLWYLESDPRRVRYQITLAYLRAKRRVKVILVAEDSRGYR